MGKIKKAIIRMLQSWRLLRAMALLVIAVTAAVALWLLWSHPSEEVVEVEHYDATPALMDSIRSIRQWELLEVEVVTDIDTSRSRYLGMVHDNLRRRYYGSMSLGIDLDNVPEQWYDAHGDSITVRLPEVILLDETFIDESRTRLLVSDSKDFEADPVTKQRMYDRAVEKMKAQGLAPKNLQKARKNAEDELTRLLKNVGYKWVEVKSEK